MADVLRLKSTDISPGNKYLTVTFRDTKTRNPYTVATALPPPEHLQPLLDAIESANVYGKLFHTSAPAVSKLLKRQRSELTQHSLRRGALQTLSAAKIPISALLHFSGHRSAASLLAYLDDGKAAPENEERAIQARVLVGGGVDAAFTPLPPPSLQEIHKCFPTNAGPRPPLHMKKVRHMDLDALLKLPMQNDTRSYLRAALRWVQDPELFETALLRAPAIGQRSPEIRLQHKSPSFTDDELEAMENYKFASYAAARNSFPVYGFPVHQHKAGKEVLRPIWEPTINDALTDEDAQELHLPTRETVLKDSTPSSNTPHIWCQLDGVSCFDQVPLHDSVRKFFTFFWNGSLQALLSLPMGFRRAVEVACAILWALLDFDRSDTVRVNSYVDNARFGGPTNETVDAVLEFVRRATSVGYQLDHQPRTREEVLAASPTQDTFLGVRYDYESQTRCLPDKTLHKLEALGNVPSQLTHRQLACLIGLGTWAGTILDFSWHRTWHLLRRYAACAVAWDPHRSVTLSPTEYAELRLLIQFCKANSPVSILSAVPPPVDTLLITDASKVGWGALAGQPGCTPTTTAGAWATFIGSSVVAEPEGAWQALQSMQLPYNPRHVRLVTDHEPLVHAHKSGRATAWAYNALLARLATLPYHVSLEFLPGVNNPADAPSRGIATTESDMDAFRRHVPQSQIHTTSHKPRFMT